MRHDQLVGLPAHALTQKFEKMAKQAAQQPPSPGPQDDGWWQFIMNELTLDRSAWMPIQQTRLSEIPQPSCGSIAFAAVAHCQISHADTVRLYGPQATWKKAGQRLLDEGCHQDDMRKTAVCRLREVIKGLARARQLANERDNEPHVVQRGLFALTILAFFLLWIAANMGRARSPRGERTIDHDL